MSRTPLIAGNWKMYKTRAEAAAFAKAIRGSLTQIAGVDAVICAPFTALEKLIAELQGTTVAVGAQNLHDAEEGAYTGEISPRMLNELGVQYVIIGHSERRAYFAETDESVNRKTIAALKHHFIPIVCVGENLDERETGNTMQVVNSQLTAAFVGISSEDASKVVVAYEPIWAIGTGKTATSSDANVVCKAIRETLASLYNQNVAAQIRIQYGGSVKPDNISALLAESDIDGALVGGASLDAASYLELLRGAAAKGESTGL